ncbi:unnamed protein product [Gemmata massiliana]|uniref:Uncharacterized protein n=1 Tax=Gemmata massiliana TaxID=1210884 RepID=A0A6P2DEI4_9BACT|nr:unnamed protein product [Gemmata massiliana]
MDYLDYIGELPDSLAHKIILEIAAATARRCVLALGTKRFGEPTAACELQLNAIEDLQRLVRITIELNHASDWDALLKVR